MSKKIALGEVPAGEDFEVWGRIFTVLCHDESGEVFVLQRTIEKEMHFNEEDSKHPMNKFSKSAVFKFLNGPYLELLNEAGPSTQNFIINFDVDLKCTLGQREYGVCNVAAGLLTLEQYGQYYDIIPRVDDPWWLATPWRTPRFCNSSYGSARAWNVNSNGNYNSSNCSGSYGVRPALLLDPSLLVSYEDGSEEEIDLSTVPTERLVSELYKRVGGGEQ
jgi:hypothetical protein